MHVYSVGLCDYACISDRISCLKVGLPGFYPFDWIAAAYVTDSSQLCRRNGPNNAGVDVLDPAAPQPCSRDPPATGDAAEGTVLCCAAASWLLHNMLVAR